MEINKVLHDPIIKMAQVNHLPDKLGLNDIARLLFYHRYEAAASDVGWFMEVLASGEFIGWVNKQIESGRIPIDGRTNRKLPLWFRDDVMEPILSRDTVKIILNIFDSFPLEEGCLLANWWTDERTDETGNQDNVDEHIIGLLPSTTHPDSEFLRLVPLNPNFKYTAEECYFRINVEEDKNNDRILRVIDSETINPLPRHSSNMDPTTTAVLSKIGKLGAEKRHNSPGGSRDKQKQIRDIWATGKYTTRGICAEEECAGLGMSYDAARKALRNTPNPDKQSS